MATIRPTISNPPRPLVTAVPRSAAMAMARFCAHTSAMMAVAPAWIAVALQKTNRNAGSVP